MHSLTRSCFLLLPLGRLSLLALLHLFETCLSSLWIPPFPLHAPTLIPPLFCQGVALAHLDSLPSYDWCFGQTALFLFLLEKAALAYLPTALSVALRPLFLFQEAQYAQVFPLKSALFCKLFGVLCSTNKSAIFLPFSTYLTLTLSSSPSFPLPQSLWQIWQELSSLSYFIRL